MKTLKILLKRWRDKSPAILENLRKKVLILCGALTGSAIAGITIIDQYSYHPEYKDYLVGILFVCAILFGLAQGLKLSATTPEVQQLSDPKTGLPKE